MMRIEYDWMMLSTLTANLATTTVTLFHRYKLTVRNPSKLNSNLVHACELPALTSLPWDACLEAGGLNRPCAVLTIRSSSHELRLCKKIRENQSSVQSTTNKGTKHDFHLSISNISGHICIGLCPRTIPTNSASSASGVWLILRQLHLTVTFSSTRREPPSGEGYGRI